MSHRLMGKKEGAVGILLFADMMDWTGASDSEGGRRLIAIRAPGAVADKWVTQDDLVRYM